MDEDVLKELREIRDKLEHIRYSEHAGVNFLALILIFLGVILILGFAALYWK